MVRKPEIQYVGQFYVHGSEARQLESQPKKQPKTKLPKPKRVKIETLYIDPVALGGILVSVVMLVVLVLGVIEMRACWQEHGVVSEYLDDVRIEHARLEHDYRIGYTLEDIESKALAIGMIPQSELPVVQVDVTVPQRSPEPTAWDEFVWFITGLFA